MRFASIQSKIFGLVVALSVALVAILTTYFPAREISVVRESMMERAAAYGRVLSRSVEAPLERDDREAARDVFASAKDDRDVIAIAIYKADGHVLASVGDFHGAISLDGAFDHPRMELLRESLRTLAPITPKNGPRGVLVLELSTRRIEAEQRRIRATALSVGAGALFVGLVLAWWIARSLARRIESIACATRAVAAGDLGREPLRDESHDEVGDLAKSFNVMHANVRSLIERLQSAGDREKTRATELDARTAEMRLVFDHVAQGLFIASSAGNVIPGGSRVLERWFGVAESGTALWDYLFSSDAQQRSWMRLCWSMLQDDVLPFEAAVAQLPRAMCTQGREFEVRYQPIFSGASFVQMLVVISDVTEQRARERADSSQRELLAMFEHITHDRAGFVEFFNEATGLVAKIGTSGIAEIDLKRAVHTLKGNASLFGVQSVSELCQALEESIEQLDASREDTIAAIADRWRVIQGQICPVIREHGERIRVDETEYENLRTMLAARLPHSTIAREIERWKFERVAARFERIAEQARAIATRIGKPNVRVVTEDNDLRLDAAAWAPFWTSFVHVVRNALDHGIESKSERVAAKKSEIGTLSVRAYVSSNEFVVELDDDGRGIDWLKLAAHGREIGVACSTQSDCEELLFSDGVTTKTEATEISGRGIGMGAVRRACIDMGGHVRVETAFGRGTTMQFRFPVSAMGASLLDASNAAA